MGGLLRGPLARRITNPFRQPRLNPPNPPSHVVPKPGGGERLPRLSLIKPGGPCDEILDRLCGHAQAVRAEVIAE